MALVALDEPYPQPITDNRVDPKPADIKASAPVKSGLPGKIAANDADSPATPRPELIEMREYWKLGDTLLQGTAGILACSDELLPPLGDDEREEEKRTRLRKAVCTPFYEDQLASAVAKPFAREVTFVGAAGDKQDMLPPQLAHLNYNCDGQGRSLTTVLREHLHEAIHRSGSCLLTELPIAEEAESELAQREQKPQIRRISLRDILGWEYYFEEPNEPGKPARMVTTMLRLCEKKKYKVGNFGEKTVDGVRIVKAGGKAADGVTDLPGFTVRYEQNDEKEWVIVEDRPFVGAILLNTTWTNQLTPTSGRPVLRIMAELNMAYVQDDSDQRNGSSYARLSTLYTIGASDDSERGAGGLMTPVNQFAHDVIRRMPTKITRGHRRLIRIMPETAKVGLLESAGTGLTVGRAELKAQEDRMERFGSSHVTAPGVTATSVRRDDDRDTSNLRAWCTATEITATDAIRDAAGLIGVDLGDEFSVRLFRDWSDAPERQQAVDAVFLAYDRTLVPARVVHQSLKRLGAIDAKEDSDTLLQEAQTEKQDNAATQAEADVQAALDAAARGVGMPGMPGMPPANPPKPPAPPAKGQQAA